MIKLNTQGENTSPQLRTVLESGEHVSFMDKVSAFAQKAICRLTGSGYAGGTFSRITKMIPAVMLAVFAFSTAQAQIVYQHNFNNLGTGTNPSQLSAPQTIHSELDNPVSTWSATGNITRDARGGGYAMTTPSGSGNWTYTLTLNVEPGYQLDITRIQYDIERSTSGGSGSTTNAQINVNGNPFGTSFAVVNENQYYNPDRSSSSFTGLTGAVSITVTGNRSNNTAIRIDDFIVYGTLTTTCTPPSTQGLTNNGPLCSTESVLATVSLAGSESGVTYELLNSSNSVVSTLVSTTTGVQSFPTTVPAGTYTVRGFATGTPSCSTAVVGTTTVASITSPTVDFSVSNPNNGPICLGDTAAWHIEGTPNATVTYNINGGPQQSVTLSSTGAAIIEYTNTTSPGNVTVNLVNVTFNSCSNNLNPQPSSIVTVREGLSITGVTASQTICPGGTFQNLGYTLNGSAFARTIHYRVSVSGGSTTNLTRVVPIGTTTVALGHSTNGLSVAGIPTTNTGTTDIVHSIFVDSITYNTAGACVAKNTGGTPLVTRTFTIQPSPQFVFNLNGNALTVNPAVNNICVPISNVTLSITTTTGGQYTVVKDGTTLGSGSVSTGTSSLLPGVNLEPGGSYVVTLVGSNGCSTVQNYTVQEVNKASFVYTINGQTVTHGSVINVCVGTNNLSFSLSGANTAAYTVTGPGAQSGTLGTSATTWNNTQSAGTYTGTLTVGSVPGLTGCDTTISYTINVNPNPVIAGNVAVNGTTVTNGNNYQICENENVAITISGTPGHFVEIWRNEGSAANFTTVGSQVGTFVIPPSGTYTYSFNAGPWATNHEGTSPNGFRDWFRVEIKNPATLCASSIDFNLKITQKPRVTLSYFEGPSPITATSGAAISNGDTVRVCYPTNFRVFFNRHSSNHTFYGNIDYVYSKDGTTAATGTITTSQAAGDNYYEIPVSAGAEGWYTLSATYPSNGCDSAVRFYLKPNPKPVYTFYKTGTTTVPGTVGTSRITFCEGYPTGFTLTGSSSLTQTYSITRTSGPLAPVDFSGTLTASAVSEVFAGLAPGTHDYYLRVISNNDPNACRDSIPFTVVVTEIPKPVLQANGITRVHGATYEYCEDEVVEYTIAGVPVGSAYTLSRTNHLGTFVIGTGGTVANQASVVTVVSDATNAGTYTLKVTNTGVSTCDTTITFTVVVNDRPDLTYIDHSPSVNCFGATTGWVRYAYSGTANTFYTYIVNTGTTDTVQTHTSTLQSQSNVQHTNLGAGNYRLILTTDKGCDTSFTFSISQPATPVTVNITGTEAACDGVNGSVTFGVSGGTPGYSVVITNSATNVVATSFTQPAAFSGYTVSNLPAATYTVTVTDANGCVGTNSFTVNSCAAADLFPYAAIPAVNASVANTTSVPFSLDIYNSGGTASTGTIAVTISLPAGFSFDNVGSGWTVTTSGNTYILTSNSTVINAGANITVSGDIVKSGTPTVGFYALVVNVVPGSGGEINANNNATVVLFNVNN